MIKGKVQPGQNKGELTGMHTANLDVSLGKDLKKGLYYCKVDLKNIKYDGLLYYGYNSLSKQDCLEVHIINFTDDIYDQELNISVGKYIRAPKKFNNAKELSEQLKKDLNTRFSPSIQVT